MAERKFIKSGIPGLDSVLGGGILEGSIVAVSGPTGVGKSTFAAQFLYNGAVESNEPGIYISIEESRKDFFFHMGGYDWDFASLERDRKFILLDYPIHEVDQIVSQPGAIAEIINSTGVKRVVIDSIMPIALYFPDEHARKTGFLKFIENLRKWGVTIMIVSEDTKMAGSGSKPGSEYGIESFTDGWINLFFRYDDRRMERDRYVEVVKMKGAAHSANSYPVQLTGKGFAVVREAPKPVTEEKPAAEKKQATPAPSAPAEKPARAQAPAKPPAAPPAPAPKGTAKPPATKPGAGKPSARTPSPPSSSSTSKPAGKGSAAANGPAEPAPGSGGKAPPIKMSPSLAARLAEAKSRLMKKK